MEPFEDSDLSLKPKNSESISERETTAKKQHKRPQSEKKASGKRANSERGRDSGDVSIIEYVKKLVHKQERAEQRGKYRTAASCKNKLSHLKHDLLSERMRELNQSHVEEKRRIREAHGLELERVDAAWYKMIQSYERKIEQMIERWELKKQRDLSNLDLEIQRLNDQGFKLRSNSIRELKRAKKYYLQAENYDEVKSIDKEIDQLSYALFKKSESELKDKFIRMHEAVLEQHGKEEAVLHQRIKRAKQEQMLQCNSQKQKIIKKYHNVVAKLEMQQALEKSNYALHSNPTAGGSLRDSRRNAQWIIDNSGEI